MKRPLGRPSREQRANVATRLARKAKRHDDKRGVLLDAAKRVLARQGVAGFTIASVALEAGVSKPVVYYYFAAREDVIAALAVHLLEREVDTLVRVATAAPTGLDAVVAVLRTQVELYADDFDAFRALHIWPQLIAFPQALLTERVYPLSARVNDLLERRLRDDQLRGFLRANVHPRELANVAWAMGQGLVGTVAAMQRLGGNTRFTLATLVDEATLMLEALRS